MTYTIMETAVAYRPEISKEQFKQTQAKIIAENRQNIGNQY